MGKETSRKCQNEQALKKKLTDFVVVVRLWFGRGTGDIILYLLFNIKWRQIGRSDDRQFPIKLHSGGVRNVVVHLKYIVFIVFDLRCTFI